MTRVSFEFDDEEIERFKKISGSVEKFMQDAINEKLSAIVVEVEKDGNEINEPKSKNKSK